MFWRKKPKQPDQKVLVAERDFESKEITIEDDLLEVSVNFTSGKILTFEHVGSSDNDILYIEHNGKHYDISHGYFCIAKDILSHLSGHMKYITNQDILIDCSKIDFVTIKSIGKNILKRIQITKK